MCLALLHLGSTSQGFPGFARLTGLFLTAAAWLRAGGRGFAPQTPPHCCQHRARLGIGSCPPDPAVPSQSHRTAWVGRAFKGQLVQPSFFSTTCSFPPQITALGKAMQPLGRSETAARTWQHRARSGVKFIEEKAIALGKKCPKCLWFMFFPQQEECLLIM